MKTKQDILVEVLVQKLLLAKVGVLVTGIVDIDPAAAMATIAEKNNEKYYVSSVGYDTESLTESDTLAVSPMIEDAVKWRSDSELAGKIVAFVRNDSDKLHSLAEFDTVSTRDLSIQLIDARITEAGNAPSEKFWTALRDSSSYYSFDVLYEFVSAVTNSESESEAIPQNMWHLGLLCDYDILNTNIKPEERLSRNRDLIIMIGQLSEESRKKISRALTKGAKDNNMELQDAYRSLQEYFKYGRKDTLRQLSYNIVQQLFVAPKSSQKKKDDNTKVDPDPVVVQPLRKKDLEQLIAETVVYPTEDSLENLNELLNELEKHFDDNSEENKDAFPSIGGVFENRPIVLENHNSQFRKIVGTACNADAWGGVLVTEESVLKDAMFSDFETFTAFIPTGADKYTTFDNSSLFEFINRFDEQFALKKLEQTDPFKPILDRLVIARQLLLQKLDLIMYLDIILKLPDSIPRWFRMIISANRPLSMPNASSPLNSRSLKTRSFPPMTDSASLNTSCLPMYACA